MLGAILIINHFFNSHRLKMGTPATILIGELMLSHPIWRPQFQIEPYKLSMVSSATGSESWSPCSLLRIELSCLCKMKLLQVQYCQYFS